MERTVDWNYGVERSDMTCHEYPASIYITAMRNRLECMLLNLYVVVVLLLVLFFFRDADYFWYIRIRSDQITFLLYLLIIGG